MTLSRDARGQRSEPSGRIVVGVDGSPASLAALGWAHRQAQISGCWIDVVGAWGFPIYFGPTNLWPLDIDLESVVRHQLQTAVDRVIPKASEVTIRLIVHHGSPVLVLLAEARNADLLVVGAHGHDEVAEMLLGSVSLRCVAHSQCPVVVVRG